MNTQNLVYRFFTPVIVLLVAHASLSPIHAETELSPYLQDSVSRRLLTEKKIVSPHFGSEENIICFPSTPFTTVLTKEADDLKPNVTIEALYLFERKGIDFSTEAAHKSLYNILRGVSSLTGIEYFSASRNKYRTFYTESYAIDSLQSKKRIADPLVNELPGLSTIFLYQNDSSFGKNYYEATYRYGGDSIAMTTINRSKFSYLLVPVIAAGNFMTHIVVVPLKERIIVYFLSCAQVPTMLGMQGRIERSFTNRVEALYAWFSDRVDETF